MIRPRLPFALVVALLLGACGENGREDREAAPAPSVDWRKSEQGAHHGVVYVEARYRGRRTSGSGFVYDAAQGLILTADHAVEAAPAITVTDHHGRRYRGRVVARAQCNDLAVLKLHDVPDDLVEVGWADEPAQVGDDVTAMSYSARPTHPESLGFAEGKVSGVNLKSKLHPLLPAISPLLSYQAAASEGASGTPLVNADGEAVGVNLLVGFGPAASAEGFVYASSAARVRRLLGQLHPGTDSALVGWESQHRCHRAMDVISRRVGTGTGGPAVASPRNRRGGHGHQRRARRHRAG